MSLDFWFMLLDILEDLAMQLVFRPKIETTHPTLSFNWMNAFKVQFPSRNRFEPIHNQPNSSVLIFRQKLHF